MSIRIRTFFLLLMLGFSIQANAQKPQYFKYFEFADPKTDDNLITLAKKEEPQIVLYTDGDTYTQQVQLLKDKGYLKIGTWIGHPTFKNSANKKRAIKEAKKVGASVLFSSATFIGTDFYVLQKNPPPVEVVEQPAETAAPSTTANSSDSPKIGVELRNLTIEERQDIERNKGAYIINVVDDSPAFEANVIPGDILIKVNGLEVKDADQAIMFIGAADTSENLTLTIIRKNSEREIIVKF